MQMSDLKSASEFANSSGLKCIIYGPPGSGKTPISATSPRPVMLVTEPGMLSMRNIKIPCYEAFTIDKIEAFFEWWFGSKEISNFDTLIVDSSSQLAEIYLQEALKNNKHGLKAYGEMATEAMVHFRKLFFMPHKHIYLIAKENIMDGIKRPFYPGKVLNIEVPHLYDAILHLGIHNVPASVDRPALGQVLSFQCRQSYDIVARDRSGRLGEFEPPDFGAIVRKAMTL